jgi:hypothetical protein
VRRRPHPAVHRDAIHRDEGISSACGRAARLLGEPGVDGAVEARELGGEPPRHLDEGGAIISLSTGCDPYEFQAQCRVG